MIYYFSQLEFLADICWPIAPLKGTSKADSPLTYMVSKMTWLESVEH